MSRKEKVKIEEQATPFRDATTPILDEGLKVNYTPLQVGGQDRILRRYSIGGPKSLRDTRCYLDRADLEYLLNVAQASPTGRVVLPCAGVEWELRESRDGHRYEIFKISSRDPQPERVPKGLVTPDNFNSRPTTLHQWGKNRRDDI